MSCTRGLGFGCMAALAAEDVRIVISSTSAKETLPGTALANGIKLALLGALGTLVREVAATGATVSSLLPDPFDTVRIPQQAQRIAGSANLAGPPMRPGALDEQSAAHALDEAVDPGVWISTGHPSLA